MDWYEIVENEAVKSWGRLSDDKNSFIFDSHAKKAKIQDWEP